MRAFFQGWKRKVGVVTLLITTVLSFVWIRSHFLDNYYDLFKSKNGSERLISSNGCLVWESFQSDTPAHYFPTAVTSYEIIGLAFVCTDEDLKNYCEVHFEFTPKDLRSFSSSTRSGKPLYRNAWSGQWRGFGYGTWRGWSKLSIVSVPYWPFVLSFSLLYAFLFLSKPAKPDRESTFESIDGVHQSAFGTFFQGWRRKAGFIILVAACVSMMAWLRSLSIADVVTFSTQEHRHEIDSANGQFKWVAEASSYSTLHFSHHSQPVDYYLKQREAISEQQREYWATAAKSRKRLTWVISYWLVTLPLTLVSILLLLFRPRQSVQKKTDERVN